MELSCVRYDLIPGTTSLFSDYLYNFAALERFYPGGEPDSSNVAATAAKLAFPEERRLRIVEALRAQNGSSASLNKLSRPDTVAIVTGQQVGLFSGPAYTIFKALTAVKLAEELESQGIPAVPIFWLATEDHDLAEVDHVWVFGDSGEPVKIAAGLLATGGPVGVTPLSDLPLDTLEAALGTLPFAAEVMRKVRAAYKDGGTLGGAFGTLLKDLLSEFNLLFLDPLHPDIRAIAAPLLSEVAERAPELVQALRDRSTELESAGYHAQVLVDKNTSLLFLLKGSRRVSLRLQDSKFISRDTEYTAQDLSSFATKLSPNALLRPVIQDYLLPTAAYIAGPAEIAYFAQSSVLYQKLLYRMPVIYPRKSFTLVDDRALKLMTRHNLRLPDLLQNQESAKARIASHLIPKDLADEFAQVRQATAGALSRLSHDLAAMDPTLSAAADKSSAKVIYQLEKLERKTARETLRRDQKASADADHLLNLVFPHKHLQERLYSIIPFLAKYGLDLPRRLYDETQLNCPDHILRRL